MQTVIVSNNATDTVLLVNNNNLVVGAWDITPEVASNYLTEGHLADEWSETYPDATVIEDYGVEYGRNGKIADSKFAGATMRRALGL